MAMQEHEHSGFEAKGPIILKDGDGQYIRLPRLTTAQRDALEASDGMEIYNSDTGQKETYGNGGWGVSLRSNPPSGKYKVLNIYWDEDIQKVVVEKLTDPES